MLNTIAGRLLYAARKEKHVTQEKVCHGVCNRTTLARIENGQIIPSLMQVETFFTRLGRMIPNNIIPLSKVEKRRNDLENEMLRIADSRDKKRLELMNEYKSCHPSWGKFEEQFYLMQLGLHLSQFDEHLQESIEIYEKALKLTVPEFSINSEIPNCLYSIKELILLNAMAHSEYYLYETSETDVNLKNRAITRMRFLKKYLEDNFRNYKTWKMYSVILFNLTNWVGLDGKIDEALNLSKYGLTVEKSSLKFFIFHLYNYGYSLASNKRIQDAESIFSDYIELYPLIDVYNELPNDIDEINTRFGLTLKIK